MANLSIIQKRWSEARKAFGLADEISTPSGFKVKGRYVLTEAGAATPSHDPLNAFQKSEGFPTDKNGQSVNDRDYERDTDAQTITRNIAAQYDSRALQSPVVVSRDGIVLSGNGRTMAGILAARDDTDAAYVGYLKSYPEKYGFVITDVLSFRHPRLLFLADGDYPYTAETFAMFNAQDIKSQSKTEQAVKLGKLVDDETFHRIIRNINTFDTIGEFYANTKASTDAISDLVKVGVISKMQQPEMFDGDTISSQAREILENVLIGKAFSTNPDAVRQITAYKGIRKNIITALAEISNNIALDDYSLERETADAIALCYQARANGDMSQGDIVSGYARQMNLFDGGTIADVNDTTMLMLADMINAEQSTRLKKLFAVYNGHARESASGQVDMFSGGVKTKEEILDEVKTILNYSVKKLDEHLSGISERRKHEARTSIYMEQSQATATRDVKVNAEIGNVCKLRLPDGTTMNVKYEIQKGEFAGIRVKGWKRLLVPASLLSPTSETVLTKPAWPDSVKDYNGIVRWMTKKDELFAA